MVPRLAGRCVANMETGVKGTLANLTGNGINAIAKFHAIEIEAGGWRLGKCGGRLHGWKYSLYER